MVERSVSPSLRAAARPPPPRGNRAKRATRALMDTIDELADDNQLSSVAYNEIAKCVKSVHEATAHKTQIDRRRFAMEYALDAPHTLAYAHPDADTNDPSFVGELTRRKQRELRASLRDIGDAAARVSAQAGNERAFSAWAGELVEHYMAPGCVSADPYERMDGLMLLTDADPDAFGQAIRQFLETDLAGRWCVCTCPDIDSLDWVCTQLPVLDDWRARCAAGACSMACASTSPCN